MSGSALIVRLRAPAFPGLPVDPDEWLPRASRRPAPRDAAGRRDLLRKPLGRWPNLAGALAAGCWRVPRAATMVSVDIRGRAPPDMRPTCAPCDAGVSHHHHLEGEPIMAPHHPAWPNAAKKGLLTPDKTACSALIDLPAADAVRRRPNFDRQSVINNNLIFVQGGCACSALPAILSNRRDAGFQPAICGRRSPPVFHRARRRSSRSSMKQLGRTNISCTPVVEKPGRKKIVLGRPCGPRPCVALPTIQMIDDGYDVYVVEDCCGDRQPAGARPTR